MGKGKRSSGSAIAAVALLLFFTGAATLLIGCAGAPHRGETPSPPAVPAGREPATAAPPFQARPPFALPGLKVPAPSPGRPVRVLLGGAQKDIRIEGDSIRAWNAAGTPVAGEAGRVILSAIGEKIRWGAGKMVDSPIDISSPSGLRVDGKPLVARVRVSARKGELYAVAVVPLEEYVAAVVSREAPPSFRHEALSALAVAVRTYALLSMEKPRDQTHDLVAGVEDQVFEGMDHIDSVFLKAAEATRGEVLSYGGALARAVYHSTCGGKTENAKDAWGKDFSFLRSVTCDDCLESPVRRWDYRMTAEEGKRVARSLGVQVKDDPAIRIASRSSTGRASRIRIISGGVSRDVSAADFRRVAGYARVRSLKMEIARSGDGWKITGEGYGHGVGMCQWGANGMAKRGKTYREILARYYPGTELAGVAH
jgi:stage II sporulation protein D